MPPKDLPQPSERNAQVTNQSTEETPRQRADKALGQCLDTALNPERFTNRLDRSIVNTAAEAIYQAVTIGDATFPPHIRAEGFIFASMIESEGRAYLALLLPSDVNTRLAQGDTNFDNLSPERALRFARGVVNMITGIDENKLPNGKPINANDMRFMQDGNTTINSVPLPVYPRHSITVVSATSRA